MLNINGFLDREIYDYLTNKQFFQTLNPSSLTYCDFRTGYCIFWIEKKYI